MTKSYEGNGEDRSEDRGREDSRELTDGVHQGKEAGIQLDGERFEADAIAGVVGSYFLLVDDVCDRGEELESGLLPNGEAFEVIPAPPKRAEDEKHAREERGDTGGDVNVAVKGEAGEGVDAALKRPDGEAREPESRDEESAGPRQAAANFQVGDQSADDKEEDSEQEVAKPWSLESGAPTEPRPKKGKQKGDDQQVRDEEDGVAPGVRLGGELHDHAAGGND